MRYFSKIKILILFFHFPIIFSFAAIPKDVWAQSPKSRYFSAEKCYKNLRNNPSVQDNRKRWLACIDQFQDVYRQDPDGPWAAAGLYMSGKLYWELYKRLSFEPDKAEAVDIFERIIKRYPKSRYRKKARDSIALIDKFVSGKRAQKGKTVSSNKDPKEAYVAGENCYRRLKANPKKQKYRESWTTCIEQFDKVYDIDPQGPWAAAGLYMKGVLYEELYKHSFNSRDLKTASEIYQKIAENYPWSRYREKAIKRRTQICKTGIRCDETDNHKTVMTPPADPISQVIDNASSDVIGKNMEEGKSGQKTTVSGIRYWSNPSYTRVVIDADHSTPYKGHLLKKDPSLKKPPRLYVDLSNSILSRDIKKTIPIDDNLLSGVRAGQYKKDTVRVVIDIKSFQSYKIFPLREPFRIVIDVWGDTPERVAKSSQGSDLPGSDKIPVGALARQLALGVSRVVIDPGHGGKDPGAVGFLKNVYEKDITLRIAKKLAKMIRQKVNCEVILTRNDDRYLTLEERTALANTKNADLFISIHANAHRNRDVYGIETFYLNLATDDESIRVAARENATSTKNISDLHSILSDLMQNAKINESSRLAAFVQESICRDMKKKYRYIKNNGVKQAPFYVLLGAQMPAILIETSFISNPRECRRLIDQKYQDRLCSAIVKGVQAYIKETNPNKISNINQKNGTSG